MTSCSSVQLDKLPSDKPYKRINKNSIKTVDLNIVAFQYFGGVDLLEIPGISHGTVLSIMSEIGPEGLDKFPSSRHWDNQSHNSHCKEGSNNSMEYDHKERTLSITGRIPLSRSEA